MAMVPAVSNQGANIWPISMLKLSAPQLITPQPTYVAATATAPTELLVHCRANMKAPAKPTSRQIVFSKASERES